MDLPVRCHPCQPPDCSVTSVMAAHRLALWLFMVCIAGTAWSQGTDLNFVLNDVDHVLMAPHRNPDAIPPGFEIRLNAEERGDSLWLISAVQLPYGGYIISATCTFDYLGKFQVQWTDTAAVRNTGWREEPAAELAMEPFEAQLVPMLLKDTKVTTRLSIEPGMAAASGELFMVLEPQCVPYRLPFTMTRSESGWSVIQGRLVSALQH